MIETIDNNCVENFFSIILFNLMYRAIVYMLTVSVGFTQGHSYDG